MCDTNPVGDFGGRLFSCRWNLLVYCRAIAGAFQGIVLVPTLLFGGGFFAVWWYSGGETLIRVDLGDTQLEGLVGSKGQREASDFVDSLLELTG